MQGNSTWYTRGIDSLIIVIHYDQTIYTFTISEGYIVIRLQVLALTMSI